MPKIAYIERQFRGESAALIERVNSVIANYAAQGYSLTLRQVYYQMVARAIIPNNDRSYKNLGSLINDARLAGLIDWKAIEDRTRSLKARSKWSTPGSIIDSAAWSYHIDYWENQPYYCEVWVEKEALADIVGQIANRLDVPFFSCRGYVSQSEMWEAAQRIAGKQRAGHDVLLLHLGDHDPSGKDMSRDIVDRMTLFGVDEDAFEFKRIALNMDQVEEYGPPPNPAKITDSRAKEYIEKFGGESWELDALEPRVIESLIRDNVTAVRDDDLYQEKKAREAAEIAELKDIARNWPNVLRLWKGRDESRGYRPEDDGDEE